MGRVPLPGIPEATEVELRAKSGKSLGRYLPEVTAASAACRKRFVLDGELVIAVDGKPSFDALQLRLHPAASRIEALARIHRRQFIVFDCLHARSA